MERKVAAVYLVIGGTAFRVLVPCTAELYSLNSIR